MERGKYIIFEHEHLVVFPSVANHSSVAAALKETFGNPVSAGAFMVEDGKPIPYGESLTLGLHSRRKEDSKIFHWMFRDSY